MENVKYWFCFGNVDAHYSNDPLPTITLPLEYEDAYCAGVAAREKGRYHKKAAQRYGVLH